MKIELLYFDGCPNWQQVDSDIKAVLREQGMQTPIDYINVRTSEEAEALRFIGSPSVRINGNDIEPDAPQVGFNLECRIYWLNGKAQRVPPREWMEEALRSAT